MSGNYVVKGIKYFIITIIDITYRTCWTIQMVLDDEGLPRYETFIDGTPTSVDDNEDEEDGMTSLDYRKSVKQIVTGLFSRDRLES